jgi:hypothetical protein
MLRISKCKKKKNKEKKRTKIRCGTTELLSRGIDSPVAEECAWEKENYKARLSLSLIAGHNSPI